MEREFLKAAVSATMRRNVSEPDAEKLTIRPFSKEEVSLQVKQTGCLLEWVFEVKNKDIEFSVHFRDEDSAELIHEHFVFFLFSKNYCITIG
ncbi:hypothetical protein AVEN_273395-1 [Araneus ventricosus]|uniref:Uncharacterized protein n=1 Tax=Araneus ventricosus TaxID=182803 RepID=A0A4Y2R9M4_ARAVE|nr:hypothetical protein AVEN_273395-1 [Araneus ventricosus]